MCACRCRRGRARRHGRRALRLSAFRLRIFLSWLSEDQKAGPTTCALFLLLVSCLCEQRIANGFPFATHYSLVPIARMRRRIARTMLFISERFPDAAQRETVRRRSGIVKHSEFVTFPVQQRTTSCCAAPGKRSQQGAKTRRENEETRPPPCKRGRGTAHKCGGGGVALQSSLTMQIIVGADAPSATLLRSVVPLPRFAGQDGG